MATYINQTEKKIKDKEKIKKQQTSYKGITIRLSADFFSRNSAGQEVAYISSDEREKPVTKNALIKTYIQILWRNQKLYIEAKAKRIQHYQTSCSKQILKELFKVKGLICTHMIS